MADKDAALMMPKPPKHLLAEPDPDSEYLWVVRTRAPSCLIRVRDMAGRSDRHLCRILVTHFDPEAAARQPHGKLMRVYREALRWLQRQTDTGGSPDPRETDIEIIADDRFRPPEFLICDEDASGDAGTRSYILSTKSPAWLAPFTDPPGQAFKLSYLGIPPHPDTSTESTKWVATAWLKNYVTKALRAYGKTEI